MRTGELGRILTPIATLTWLICRDTSLSFIFDTSLSLCAKEKAVSD